MAARTGDFGDGVPAKRQKTSAENVDPRNNPYLAHMYEGQSNGYSSGTVTPPTRTGTPLDKMERHKSTSKQAQAAEDGDINPFTGRPFSERYISILKTRRNLPVHSTLR